MVEAPNGMFIHNIRKIVDDNIALVGKMAAKKTKQKRKKENLQKQPNNQ